MQPIGLWRFGREGVLSLRCAGLIKRPAEWNSAKQQIKNLRYGLAKMFCAMAAKTAKNQAPDRQI
jgi:hypothetical protein